MRPDDAALTGLLRASRRIAIVGLGPNPERPAYAGAEYFRRAGYTVLPVHPAARGPILGAPVYPRLRAAAETGPVDIVVLFRRPAAVPWLVDDCVAVGPRLVWMQVGIHDSGVAHRLEAAGIPVVMDRCLMVDHRQLLR